MTLVQAGMIAKDAMATLGMMAVQGTVLALIALALVRIAKPRTKGTGSLARPAWRAAIWTVVLVKFALPWGPAMPWSLSDLFASLSTTEAVAAPAVMPVSVGMSVAPSMWPAIGWLALAAVWLAGAMFVFVRAVRAQRAAVRFARSAPAASDDATALLRELAATMRVRRARLVVGDDVTGPYVVGVLRPIIVAPPSLLADPALLRAALLHELAHVRRLDAIGRAVQLLATSMYFFWPVVRLVGKRLDLAREAACDAWALESSAVSRPAYARLLVNMASLRSAAAANLAVRRTLDARVSAVLGPAVRARLGVFHWLALGAWAAVALGGARPAVANSSDHTCRYTPSLANALFVAHPEADRDGDGFLSKDEACVFQIEFVRARHHGTPTGPQVSTLSSDAQQQLDQLLTEPLCCNCGPSDGMTPAPGPASSVNTSCQRVEGEAP